MSPKPRRLVELARAVLNGSARRDDVENLARLVLVRELPPLFDCGCSKHKASTGRTACPAVPVIQP